MSQYRVLAADYDGTLATDGKVSATTLNALRRWKSSGRQLILITGEENVGKKTLAKTLEKRLFQERKLSYFLGIRNILYGVDADISHDKVKKHNEHIRRLSEIAYILLDLGTITIITARTLTKNDLNIIKTSIPSEKIMVVWLGEHYNSEIDADLVFPAKNDLEETITEVKAHLKQKGVLFSAW